MVLLISLLAFSACSTDASAPTLETPADPEGEECIAKGYEFASALYATCRNELVEENRKKLNAKGIY